MTITINPYADVLNFPPGTPASVINAVLAMRSRNDAMANQPNWWETGINNILTGFNKDLLTPWLQNNLVNLPYQTDLSTMRADQAMREFAGNQGVLTSEQNQRALDKYALEQQAQTDLGGAIGMATQAYQGTPESFSDTGPTTPYGSYEDPWTSSPGPTYSPPLNNFGNVAPSGDQPTQPGVEPTQLQGEVAPTSRDRIMKYTPENNPTSADMFRTVAGQSPLNAGILAQLFEKNQNVSRLLDPVQQKFINSQIAKNEASTGNLESQTTARNTLLPAQLQALVDRGILTEAQARLVGSQTMLTNEKAQGEAFRNNYLAGASPEQLDRVFAKSKPSGALPPMLAARQAALMFKNPNLSPDDALVQAIQQQDTVNPAGRVVANQATLPVQIASNLLPKIQTGIDSVRSYDNNLESVNNVMVKLHEAAPEALPKSNTYWDISQAFLWRQMHPDIMAQFDVAGAEGAAGQMLNAIKIGAERGVGDKAARFKGAYGNLPENPTMLPYAAWAGQYRLMKDGVKSDYSDLIDLFDRTSRDAMSTSYGNPKLTPPPSFGTTASGKKVNGRYNPLTNQVEPVNE